MVVGVRASVYEFWGDTVRSVTQGYRNTASSPEGVHVYVSAHVCACESACVCTCPRALLPAFFFATKAHRATDGFVAHLWEPCPHPSKVLLLLPLRGLPETHTASLSRAVPSQPLSTPGCQQTGKREWSTAGKGRNQGTRTGGWHFYFKRKKWSLSFSAKHCPRVFFFSLQISPGPRFWKRLRNSLALLV